MRHYWCTLRDMPMDEPEVYPGDVFHSASSRWLGRAIRWAGKDKDGPAFVNHTGLVVSRAACIQDAEIIEAVGKIRHVRLGDVYSPEDTVTVWRPRNIPPEDIDLIVAAARGDVGNAYPWWQLIFHLADAAIPGKPAVFRRLAGVSGRLVCSASLGAWFARAGYTFGTSTPEALTPDDIHDYQRATPRHWSMVRSLSPLRSPLYSGPAQAL